MNLERYIYFASRDFKTYSFYSEGPKGRIKKTVIYSKLLDDPTVYNLAFGDEDLTTGKIDDDIITDNDDRDIVLATVAGTIIDFCKIYGNQLIYAEGSSASRTRLYQMGIAKLLDEISIDFEVFGIIENDIYKFERNINYEAFFVRKK